MDENKTFAYNPTKGLLSTREFLAKKRNSKNGARITADDICFFNGLGDAISKIYTYLRKETRVIVPSPAYSTHSSAEAAHAGYPHITYNLLPEKNWLPDLKDLENKIKYNPYHLRNFNHQPGQSDRHGLPQKSFGTDCRPGEKIRFVFDKRRGLLPYRP